MIPRSLSVRSKITLALLAAIALSIASTGFFTVRQSYDALGAQAEEEALALATALAEPVDELLSRLAYSLGRLSREPAIVGMDPVRQLFVLDLMTTTSEPFDGMIVSDPAGKVIRTDGTGTPTMELLPPDPEAALRAPAASGRTTFSEGYRSTSGQVCVLVGAPILRRGIIIGVLSGVVALERHSLGGMKGIRFGRSGYAYIVDSKGRALSHPNPEQLLRSLSAFHPPPALGKTPRIQDWVNTEGEARLAATVPIAGSDWQIVVSRLRDEAYAPARRLLTVLLQILAFGLAVSFVIGAALARWIAKPISTLMRGVAELSSGRPIARIEPGAGDEIGQLTSAFNDMAASLTRTIRHLEAFGYSVAHDLRAPARTVTAFAELILKNGRALDEETRSHVRRIQGAGQRLRLMLDGLMTLSRLAQDIPRTEVVDLSDLARRSAGELAATEPERRVDLRILRTLLRCVMDNAWIFTRGRDGVRIEVGREARRGGAPVFFVRDNGPGFDPALAERLFRPFHRLPNAQGVPGIGIGLAAAARIVELHGGTIRAESRPGEGTAILFTLGEPR